MDTDASDAEIVRKRTKYEALYGEQVKEKILCEICKRRYVIIHIDPVDKGRLKVLCRRCKIRKTSVDTKQNDAGDLLLSALAKDMLKTYGSSEVKIYRPGDPDFDEIAAQCDLQPKKEKPYYNAFEGRNYFKKPGDK